MHWTKESPCTEGYYWIRNTPQATGSIVYVARQASGDWQVHTAGKYAWPLGVLLRDYPDTQWSNTAIAVPSEPQTAMDLSWD